MQGPRDENGRFIKTDCPDLNCGGTLRDEGYGWWRCDGLTHKGDCDSLEACTHMHHDGDPVAAWA